MGKQALFQLTATTNRVRAKLAFAIARHHPLMWRTFRQVPAHWNQFVLSRKPTLCILQEAFLDLPDSKDDELVFDLSKDSVAKVFSLATLTPFMSTHVRVKFSHRLACTNASSSGFGERLLLFQWVLQMSNCSFNRSVVCTHIFEALLPKLRFMKTNSTTHTDVLPCCCKES